MKKQTLNDQLRFEAMDARPHSKLCQEALERICELERTLRWIAGIEPHPVDPALREAMHSAAGMRAFAHGVMTREEKDPG